MDTSKNPVTSDVLLTLQLRTGNEPLLPRLERFKCKNATKDFIPFISLFLAPKTTHIRIEFILNPPTVVVALAIARFPILCPHIQSIILDPLPSNLTMTETVSEMLVACNRDTLEEFHVTCPLTEEARGVLYTLPKLRHLWAIIQGQTSLPPVILPKLEKVQVEWDSGRDWLQGFWGATIGKLETVIFCPTSDSAQIGNFLEEFKGVALTTSAQNTLSEFSFYTSQSWTPDYPSLLVFGQMTKLEIEFSCYDRCSSRVDDGTVLNLAQAMPKLEILRLGKEPCRNPTGIALEGLVALASHCLQLSKLRIHLQAGKLAEAITRSPYPPKEATAVAWSNCALTDLEVGRAPIPGQAASAIALALLQIFPQILNIGHANPKWNNVAEMIRLSKRVGGHIHHASKTHLPHLR